MYEVLSESDALEKYKDHFDVPPPSYEGDTSGGGSITPGGSGGSEDNAIDISAFVSPGTKNNLDLAAYAVQAWENSWGYVWGTYGNVLTPSLFDYKLQQYPDGVGKYADLIRENWLNRRTADCVGLIKGYGWLDVNSLEEDLIRRLNQQLRGWANYHQSVCSKEVFSCADHILYEREMSKTA